jgi:hypothetical protein
MLARSTIRSKETHTTTAGRSARNARSSARRRCNATNGHAITGRVEGRIPAPRQVTKRPLRSTIT